MLRKPLGNVTFRMLLEAVAEGDALQATRQRHVLHALVDTSPKSDALQGAGQHHVRHALLEVVSKMILCELIGSIAFSMHSLKQGQNMMHGSR